MSKKIIIVGGANGVGKTTFAYQYRFMIHLVYVFLDDHSLCKKRVSARVKMGGHNVPEEDIERRFYRSITNFRKIYLPFADTWQIIYNGLKRPLEIAIGDKDSELIMDEGYYNKLMELSK